MDHQTEPGREVNEEISIGFTLFAFCLASNNPLEAQLLNSFHGKW